MLPLFIISAKQGLTGREKYLFMYLHQNALQPFPPEPAFVCPRAPLSLSMNLAGAHFICICPRGLSNVFRVVMTFREVRQEPPAVGALLSSSVPVT